MVELQLNHYVAHAIYPLYYRQPIVFVGDTHINSVRFREAKAMNILIAEDTPTIQVFNCSLLSSWGFNFDMASDGTEAIDYAYKNKGKYDLCLMDIEMPKMNGIEAARIIRRELPYFPIAAITADPSYRSECLASGRGCK